MHPVIARGRRSPSLRRTLTAVLFASAVAACSGGSSGSGTGGSVPIDDSPLTPTNAAGLWTIHYEWSGTPPAAWTTFWGTAASGDRQVAIPSESQKRGMFGAETDWGFAPMTSVADSGNVTWTFSLNSSKGPFTLDFEGTGTGAKLSGTAKVSNDSSVSATWTATKVGTAFMTAANLAGDWTVDFQWSGRTPGQLLVTCDGAGACKIPGGQAGGPKTDDNGTATVSGNQVTLKFSNATHLGVATSDAVVWGYMDSTDGNTGIWTATRGRPSSSSSSSGGGGCTADVDCGSCERCERTTGNCVARLTC